MNPKQESRTFKINRSKVMIKLTFSTIIFTLAACVSGFPYVEKSIAASDEVVVLLDNSGTYTARRADALNKATELLNSIAQTKVKRWETSTINITIISLDAVPEVIWHGNLTELKAVKPSEWTDRFNARTDYRQCTDVDAAFTLASDRLQGDPKYVGKYIFAFTDLINEPPTNSIRKCRPPSRPSLPTDAFPWDSFRDVSVCVFWVPPEQKLAWQRAVAEHGLSSSFSLYSTSESSQVKAVPPPKPEVKITDADKEADRTAYVQYAYTVLTWLLIAVGGALLLFVGLYFFGKRFRTTGPAGGSQRSRHGIRPLPASALSAPRRPGQVPPPGGTTLHR